MKLGKIYSELEEMRSSKFPSIKKWECKPVTREYAFELPIPHGFYKVLKIVYSASFPPLPRHLSGENFEYIFGTHTSMLELFILKNKIMGPCWMTIKNFTLPIQFTSTW